MTGVPTKGAGVQYALGVWRRRRWLVVVAFATPLAAALGLISSLPNIYQSTATVLVERQQVPEAFVKTTVTSDVETRLKAISQETLSRSRLEDLIRRFGLYSNLKTRVSPEALIERLRRDIKLESHGNDARRGTGATVAFTISYQGSEPQTVARVTNELASFYIEENLRVRERQASGTSEFLKIQLEETKGQLDEQEERLSAFKRRYVGELPQQAAGNLAQLEQLTAQLRFNNDKQTRVLWLRDSLNAQVADAQRGSDSGEPDSGSSTATAVAVAGRPVDPAETRLERLRQALTELRSQYTEKYPEIIRLKAEIASLERELGERPAESGAEGAAQRSAAPAAPRRSLVRNPTVARLNLSLAESGAELKALKDEEGRLRSAIAVYQARVENTPRREQELEELSRGYEITKEHYRSLLKRYEEAQLAQGMEQRQKGEQFRLLDPAHVAEKPTAPDRRRLFSMSLLLSLALAGAAVMLAERIDTSCHSVDELRTLTTVPVLSSIPRIVTADDALGRRRRLRLAAMAVVVGLLAVGGAGALIARDNERLVWMLLRGGS
jgi:polysaccharide chain length determinant protein (PEP-CTERM system associated)